MIKMNTAVDTNENLEQAFWAGIALEKCKRNQGEEILWDTSDALSADPTSFQISNIESEACYTLYEFMMKKKMPYGAHLLWSLPVDRTFESYTYTLYDSWGQIASPPNVCILPTPPSHPLLYLVDVPNDVKQHLVKAISLVNKYFIEALTMDVHWEQDPETDEEWIVLEVTIEDKIDQVLEKYDQYSDEWVSSVPWPEREKIRLSYNIL